MKWTQGRIRIVIGIVVLVAAVLAAFGIRAALKSDTETEVVQETPQASKNKKERYPWENLTPSQKEMLAPLEPEWSQLSNTQQQKWLRVAKKMAKMSPEKRERAQKRINEWVKMTPEERRIARENFQSTQSLDAQEKSEKWQAYQKLPESKKRELAARARAKRKAARNSNPEPVQQQPVPESNPVKEERPMDVFEKRDRETPEYWK